MTRISKAALATKIATKFPDNVNGEITEAGLREVTTDTKDSFTHLDDFEAHLNDTNNPHSVTAADVGLGSVLTDLAAKQGIAATNNTGLSLRFNETCVHGDYNTPENGGAITANLTGAKPGYTIIVVHSAGSEPTYGSEFIKLHASEPYTNGQRNYLTFTYIGASKIIFRIDRG